MCIGVAPRWCCWSALVSRKPRTLLRFIERPRVVKSNSALVLETQESTRLSDVHRILTWSCSTSSHGPLQGEAVRDEQRGEHSHRRRQCKRGFGKQVTEVVRHLNFIKIVSHLVDFGKNRFCFCRIRTHCFSFFCCILRRRLTQNSRYFRKVLWRTISVLYESVHVR